MNQHGHTVVWIDHRMARIFVFNGECVDHTIVHHRAKDDNFLREVATALSPTSEILIFGPGHVKWELQSYLNLHAPRLSQQILAVANSDHTSDRQIVEQAQNYFSRIDHMTLPALTQNR